VRTAIGVVALVLAVSGTTAATAAGAKSSPVTAKLLLDKKQVKAGVAVKGRLVLTNPTDHTIDLRDDCAPQWDVVLGTGKKAPPVAFTQICAATPFPVKPGADPYPFRVPTKGLEPGKYHAFLVASDPSFPHAKRVPVTIVARP
jgi:hypothetical protein